MCGVRLNRGGEGEGGVEWNSNGVGVGVGQGGVRGGRLRLVCLPAVVKSADRMYSSFGSIFFTSTFFASTLTAAAGGAGGTYGSSALPSIVTRIERTAGSSKLITHFFSFLSSILSKKFVTFPPNREEAVEAIRLSMLL